MTELLRDADQQNAKIAATMGNLEEIPAKRKLVSLLYISIGKTGRKKLMDQFPNIDIVLIELRILVQIARNVFRHVEIGFWIDTFFSRETKDLQKRYINFERT